MKMPGPYVPLDVNYSRDRAIAAAGEAAELLFVRGMAYCKSSYTEGFIADFELPIVAARLGKVRQRVESLVREELWLAVPGGWHVRSWSRWNESSEDQKAKRERDAERQRRKRAGDTAVSPNGVTADVQRDTAVSPGPKTEKRRDREETELNPSSDAASPRPDVERLCTLLADLVEQNGSKRPTITERWRSACRLLIDTDQRTETQVEAAIRWCQADEFWRSNVMAMPKLREKYDQLRLSVSRNRAPPIRQSTTDLRVADAYALADKFAGYENGDGS